MSQTGDSLSLQTLVQKQVDGWHAGQRPDAASVLRQHPELHASRPLVMQLILAEYELRQDAGDATAAEALCDDFPDYRKSIAKLLEVYPAVDRRPSFADGNDRVHWPVAGDEFLGFALIEPLGVGGLARVFLAREIDVGNRFVVVKISPFGNREAQTLGKLSHPSIVPIYSVVQDEAREWTVICMPLLGVATGVDLLDRAFPKCAGMRDGELIARVARETVPLEGAAVPGSLETSIAAAATYGEAVARLALQLAEALVAAHAAGIVHRDIKLSNVLLAWSGRAMLLDFNLSTETGTNAAGLGGTLPYMAPELVAALEADDASAARSFRPASDLYSLGVVLYELLSGQLPAKPTNAERLPLTAYQAWLAAKQCPIVPLRQRDAAIDPRLEAIVGKCLAFDAAERYASAEELAIALRSYLSRGAQLGRLFLRRRREVVLAAVGLLVGGTALATYIGTRPSELEYTYQRGLALYNEGKFAEAEQQFTRCLQLQSGWPDALFGRAQALRKQGKWREARADFLGIEDVHKGWAHEFAGFCSMRIPDTSAAFFDYNTAYNAGLRDIPFLLNFAQTQKQRQKHAESASLLGDVLAVEPGNKEATCDRALANLMVAKNSPTEIPSEQAFRDAIRYRELESSYDGSFVAAWVHAEAARKDKAFQDEAIRFLTEAVRKGLPKESLATLPAELKCLLPLLDAKVLQSAPSVPVVELRKRKQLSVHELPESPSLAKLLRETNAQRSLLARRK